jgi:hypothetical protein
MTKRLIEIALIFCSAMAYAQTPTPIINPHVTFVDASGLPCMGCALWTYAAGTTTPQATYTDSTGSSVHTNPIILDAAGGAEIWLGALSYKFILKDTSGVVIWSVDNVTMAKLYPCQHAAAIQIANTAMNGFTCDSTITIDTVNHTLNVGTLPAAHVTIAPLGTATSWTLDTTSPTTLRSSIGLGSGTIGQLAYYETGGTVTKGTTAIPDGITATTQDPNDNSTQLATTEYVETPGSIKPTSVKIGSGVAMTDNQGTGTKVQHSSGTTTTGHLAAYDANGNTVDSGMEGSSSSACTNFASTSSAGCTVTADGKWMQWKTGTECTTRCDQTVTFPISFTTACYSVQTTDYATDSSDTTTHAWVQTSACTTTDVAIQLRIRGDEGSSNNIPIVWAIGK